MSKKKFDSMMVFDEPILIEEDGVSFPVYGLLYSQEKSDKIDKTEDDYKRRLKAYACYLLAVEKLQADGGKVLDKDTWMTKDGEIIDVSSTIVKGRIYRQLKDELKCKLFVFPDGIKYSNKEVADALIISQILLDRYGISYLSSMDI